MKLERPQLSLVYFAIVAAATVPAITASSFALRTADSDRVPGIVQTLVTAAILLAGLSIITFGRQALALAKCQMVRRSKSQRAVPIWHTGAASLAGRLSTNHGFFSRALIAGQDGITLWAPFHRSSFVAWNSLEHIDVEAASAPGRSPMIRLTRTDGEVLRFVPLGRHFAGRGIPSIATVHDMVENLRSARNR